MEKICFRCKLKIGDKENYYSFVEFLDGEIIDTNYCHKKCWNKFLGDISNVDETMGIIRGLKDTLIDKGLISKTEVIV